MPTIKEIAELAGVSRGTVDRVLNNRGAVSSETAEKVRKIASALSYSPNLAGRTLAVRKKNLRFGFILFSSTASNPFFLDVVKGIESQVKELEEYGVTVEIRYAEIDNPSLQVSIINQLVELGIDGLAITPINHPIVVERIRALTAAGFPVITTNSDVVDSGRLAYVGSDYSKSGETAAGLMNLVTGGKANVGIVIGHPWVHCHSERAAGFIRWVEQSYPDIRIVDTTVNYDDDLESFAVTSKMLQAHPEMDALYLAAAGVTGACRAVDDLGLRGKIKVICYDTTPSTCQLIREGAIVAAIAQQAFTQGAKPLQLLLQYVGMGIPMEDENYYTKIEIKIRENL